MDSKVYVLLVAFVQLKLSHSHKISVSGEVSNNVTFLHKTFPVPPSMRAIIDVNVSYPISSVMMPGNYPILGIYTTKEHVNIEKQCTQKLYGQLLNRELHHGITTEKDHSGKVSRTLSCASNTVKIHCKGRITIQDFIPRKNSFSFGFLCNKMHPLNSLMGLRYHINIYVQTNSTHCSETLNNSTMGILLPSFQVWSSSKFIRSRRHDSSFS